MKAVIKIYGIIFWAAFAYALLLTGARSPNYIQAGIVVVIMVFSGAMYIRGKDRPK